MSNQGLILLIVLAAITIYLVWDTYFMGALEYVKSTVDGREYQVQSLPDKQDAADLLAKIREKMIRLVDHLRKSDPEDERVKQILERFNPNNISEGADNSKYTSYSINKGERIVFCLRSRDAKNQLMDENTMIFVALHEISHVGTKSTGHTEEFWDNFRWILEESIQIGIYKQQDFRKEPVKYCGTNITSSPLDH